MAKSKKKTEKTEEEMSRIDKIVKAYDKISNTSGEIQVMGAGEVIQDIPVIPSGIPSLDKALGVGGYPQGRIGEVIGPAGVGKTSITLHAIASAQKHGGLCAFVDAEHALDPKLVRNMGKEVSVNPDKICLIQAFTGDDNLEIAEKLMKTNEVDVCVVDSVSALLPKDMAEGEIGDTYIGLLARLMSKACMKLTPIANRTNTLLIFVNQIRHSIGKWGDDRITTGGEALSFYTTGRIKVEGGEAQKSRIIDDKGVVIGHESDFQIVKNKLAAPWRKAKIDLIYGRGYNFISEVVTLGIDFGLIEQSGSRYVYEEKKYHGKRNLVNAFRDDAEIYDVLRIKVKELLGLGNE